MELRGGERFLAITSTAAGSLAGARLLREGDAEGGWQLQSIAAQAGVFQVNGQTQRVAVPSEVAMNLRPLPAAVVLFAAFAAFGASAQPAPVTNSRMVPPPAPPGTDPAHAQTQARDG